MDMIGAIMSGQKIGGDSKERGTAPKLEFDDSEMAARALSDSEHLRNKAMSNLRERRHRLK